MTGLVERPLLGNGYGGCGRRLGENTGGNTGRAPRVDLTGGAPPRPGCGGSRQVGGGVCPTARLGCVAARSARCAGGGSSCSTEVTFSLPPSRTRRAVPAISRADSFRQTRRLVPPNGLDGLG